MITPLTFTGWPDRTVGENFAPRAAATAAACSSGWPLTADAEITFPCSSIKTCTFTAPLARTARAAAGYGGRGKVIALPFNTPPEIFLGTAALVGSGGGGSGMSVDLIFEAGVFDGDGVGLDALAEGSGDGTAVFEPKTSRSLEFDSERSEFTELLFGFEFVECASSLRFDLYQR